MYFNSAPVYTNDLSSLLSTGCPKCYLSTLVAVRAVLFGLSLDRTQLQPHSCPERLEVMKCECCRVEEVNKQSASQR
jgi:hypothetical protein